MQWTARDLARMFQVSENAVARWVRQDALAASEVSGEPRFNPMGVAAWVTRHDASIPDAFVQALEEPGRAVGGLGESLERGGIVPRVVATEKAELAAELAAGLSLPDDRARASLAETLGARTDFGGQLFCDGVLAPQARYPLIVPLAPPSLTLYFLQTPLALADAHEALTRSARAEYVGAANRRLVDTVLLLVAPTVAAHLSLLTQLKAALFDLEFRDLLKQRQSPDRIFRAAHRLRRLSSADVDEPLVRSD